MPRVHLFLLRGMTLLLPASFRQEYWREMHLLIREEYSQRRGVFGGFSIWLRLVPDLVETALRLHGELFAADFRGWLRLVRSRKGLAVGLIGSFAASIALASAMFSVTYALLLRSLPYADPGRLVNLDKFPTVAAHEQPGLVRDWMKTQSVFHDIAYYSPWQANLDGATAPLRVEAADVSTSFFNVFGQSVLLGSFFEREDENYAVISHGVWQTHFGGDPAIVGKSIRLNGQELRVSGVMRPGFRFPDKTQVWTHCNPRMFFQMAEEQQAVMTFVTARLKKGVPYARGAEAAMALSVILVGQEALRFPKAAIPLQRALTASIRRPVTFLSLAAALLLALGCASATGLLAARNAARRKDLAIRFALGANGSRIRRQSLLEGVLFALCGGALGTWATYALVKLIPTAVLPAGIGEIPVDATVLGAGILTALCCGAITGWAAGWNATMRYRALPYDSWMSTVSAPLRFRRWLLAGQIGLSVTLLVWAGLQGKSLLGLMRLDLGFDPERLVAATVSFKGSPYRTVNERRGLVERWQERIHTIPGTSAAAISSLPMRLDAPGTVGFHFEDGTRIRAAPRMVSANFLSTVGGTMMAGRDFGREDREDSEPVAMVNEQFARAAGRMPAEIVGTLLREERARQKAWRIVGVYRRQATYGPAFDAGPELTTALEQGGPTFLSLMVRVPGRPVDAVDQVAAAIRAEGRGVTVFDVRPMSDYLSERLANQRLYAAILGLFAGLSCLTSLAGLLSIALFYVASRQRELGIRMALGARGLGLAGVVVRDALPLLIAGAVLGEALAIAGSKGIASLLVKVKPLDPIVHAGLSAGWLVCGMGVILMAAVKAARIDPYTALRSE
ncbi:MAG TPA: ABC transporter permease [Bryobacteraceae bacterium]|nr:ABC transporter permease [Bryobacteraceae bacterium]